MRIRFLYFHLVVVLASIHSLPVHADEAKKKELALNLTTKLHENWGALDSLTACKDINVTFHPVAGKIGRGRYNYQHRYFEAEVNCSVMSNGYNIFLNLARIRDLRAKLKNSESNLNTTIGAVRNELHSTSNHINASLQDYVVEIEENLAKKVADYIRISTEGENVVVNLDTTEIVLDRPEKHQLSLTNGWENYGKGYGKALFTKDDLGFVNIQGLVKKKHDVENKIIATLPEKYRPSGHQIFNLRVHPISEQDPALQQPDYVRVDVTSDGYVVIRGNVANWVSLSGVRYFVD